MLSNIISVVKRWRVWLLGDSRTEEQSVLNGCSPALSFSLFLSPLSFSLCLSLPCHFCVEPVMSISWMTDFLPCLAVSILSMEISISICQIEFLFHVICQIAAGVYGCVCVTSFKEFISTNIIYFLCHSHSWIVLRNQSTIFVVNLCMQ